MNTEDHTIIDKKHMEILVNRLQIQRNDALNQIALLETELIKAQKTIEELKKTEK
jgi:hypothetical protein